MEKLLIFAGTTEGRIIGEYVETLNCMSYISTATEYGAKCLEETEKRILINGRMDRKEICDFLREKRIDLVIDATHPYAEIVTKNLKTACEMEEVEYLRCVREAQEWDKDGVIVVDDIDEAVQYLESTSGNILIATGSKQLSAYSRISEYKKRCYARVLSTLEAVTIAVECGYEGKHLIAMQGPFSEELNSALIRHVDARYFVTKESGNAGGFWEKLEAVRKCGCEIVVIKRPYETGMYVDEILSYLRERYIK